MGLATYEELLRPASNGVEFLPKRPGIYVIFNTVTRRSYVGYAKDLARRCSSHAKSLETGYILNGLLRRDNFLHGPATFIFYAPLIFSSYEEAGGREGLEFHEYEWMLRLISHEECHGYNFMLLGSWTRAARFRDHERKRLRGRASYCLLDGVDLYDPINPELVRTWEPIKRLHQI